MNIEVILLFALMAAIVALVVISFRRENKKIAAALSNFKLQASKANNRNAAIAIKANLREWTRQNCWYVNHISAAKQVLWFIDGRISALPE